MTAIIIVPAHGKDKGPFLECATRIKQDCFSDKGSIFKAFSMKGTGGVVKFLPTDTSKSAVDYMTAMRSATKYIVLSHMGEVDGPILYEDHGTAVLDMQPWATQAGTQDLQMMGAIHWGTVGRSRNNKVEILLFGCNSALSYSKIVARYSSSRVWGFKNSCPSAIPTFSISAVNKVLKGKGDNTLVFSDP